MPGSSIYESCTDVLGKGRDDLSLHQLIENLQQKPVLALENEHGDHYEFPEYGIELIFNKRNSCFMAIAFFVDAPCVREGKCKRYPSTLLNGVTPADSIQDVKRKVDAVSEHLETDVDNLLSYTFGEQRVTFYFDKAGRQMSLVLVKLERECHESLERPSI